MHWAGGAKTSEYVHIDPIIHMPEVIAHFERVYRSILTPSFLTACQDWRKSFTNQCSFWSTGRATEVCGRSGRSWLLRQILLTGGATTKLHMQLDVQQGPCECVSVMAHRTTAVCTAELITTSFCPLYFHLQGTLILTFPHSIML